MKCQYCNQNDAENTFIVFMMGEEREVHLCGECTEKLRQYHNAMQHAYAQQAGAWQGGEGAKRDLDSAPFPLDAGSEIKARRKLNGLRVRLQEAVTSEQYEEAARLRDEIAYYEKEVYACES